MLLAAEIPEPIEGIRIAVLPTINVSSCLLFRTTGNQNARQLSIIQPKLLIHSATRLVCASGDCEKGVWKAASDQWEGKETERTQLS